VRLFEAADFPEQSKGVIAWMDVMLADIGQRHKFETNLWHFVAEEPKPDRRYEFLCSFHKVTFW